MSNCDVYTDCEQCPSCVSMVFPGDLESKLICLESPEGAAVYREYLRDMERWEKERSAEIND